MDDNFDKKVNALEMEVLNPSTTSDSKATATASSSSRGGASEMSQRIDQLIILIRLYINYYPKISILIGSGLFLMILLKFWVFRHHGETMYLPPHLRNHYGDLQSYYDLQMAKIDHWCLKGGDSHCQCNDPTEPFSRTGVGGWLEVHRKNKEMASMAASSSTSSSLDVVFLGDGTTQAWTGRKMLVPILGGNTISRSFNQTFHKSEGGLFDGIALGIDGDSVRTGIIFMNSFA